MKCISMPNTAAFADNWLYGTDGPQICIAESRMMRCDSHTFWPTMDVQRHHKSAILSSMVFLDLYGVDFQKLQILIGHIIPA